MIELIKNTDKVSHSKSLNILIKNSKEVFIAVAFLKKTGINEFINNVKTGLKNGTKFTFIVGRHFALTEPIALRTLFELFKGNNSLLYLAPLEAREIFHPKLYIGISGQRCVLLSGSANLTGGGLINNYECSLLYKGNTSDDVCKQALLFKKELLAVSKIATLRLLKNYETFYEAQKKVHKKIVSAPKVSDSELVFDPEVLRKHIAMYKKEHGNKLLLEKLENYKQARQILDKIAINKNLTKQEFCLYIDELIGGHPDHTRLWNSGGISRGKNGKSGNAGVYSAWKKLRDLVKFVKQNRNKEPKYVYGKGKKIIDKINYAGVNLLGEIMMTYNPDRFANINSNPVKVLKYSANLEIKRSANHYNAEEYQEYCDIISEMVQELNFTNMIEADSFFNEKYWYLKRKGVIK